MLTVLSVNKMRYREIKPAPLLSRFIECFWTLESDANGVQVEPERILPDGCVEMILNFGAQFRERLDDGRDVIQPMNFLVGQMTRPMLITTNGRVELIGIRFQPGGTLPFFKIPMQQLTNQVVELTGFSRELEDELVTRLGEEQGLNQKVVALQTLLAKRVVKKQDASSILLLAAKVVDRGGQVTIEELASDAGISCRQLERRFLGEVGVGPKLLCRILRFQQVFRAIDRNDSGWAAVAADCGYYDQAHLIRDFRQFAGHAPSVLFAQASPLTQFFTRRERMSDLSKTSAARVY